MNYGLLFTKTSTCYGNPDIEYLDEVSEYKMEIQSKKTGQSIAQMKWKNEQLRKDIDYLTKEEHGRVHAAGYLRSMLLKKREEAPEKWDNEKRKKSITSAIENIVKTKKRYRGAIGHKLVFSVKKDLEESVEKAGLNLDLVLSKEVKKIMSEFQEKFHKGEKIGYAWGIHHDSKNRHIHIFLSNRTDKGTHVAMSNPLKSKKYSKYQQKDQMGYVKDRLLSSEKRIEKKIIESQKSVENIKVEEIKIKPESIKESKDKKKISAKKPFKFQSIDNLIIERQEKVLNLKKDTMSITKDTLSTLRKEHFEVKKLVAEGWADSRELGEDISDLFAQIKDLKNRTNKENSLLKSAIDLAKNTKSKTLRMMIYSTQKIARTKNPKLKKKLLEDLKLKQIEKEKIIKRTLLLKEEENSFLKQQKKLQKMLKKQEKEFYKSLKIHRRNIEKKNFSDFMNNTQNSELRIQYFKTLKSIKAKNKLGKDISKEREFLKYLNLFIAKNSSENKEVREESVNILKAKKVQQENINKNKGIKR